MEPIEIVLIAIALLAVFFITTLLLKRFTKAQTFYIFSMIRTTRFLPLLDKFAKHKKILNVFADIGIVLGFGAIGIDFIIGKRLGKKMRALVFIASIIMLFEFFNAFFPVLLSNPFIEQYNFWMSIGFAIMGFAGFLIVSLAAYSQFVISSALAGEKACPGVAPLIPGVSIPNFPITVPLHGWISLLIILVVHEGMHGVLARKAKLKIKSAGLLLLGFLPIGAFVEPDDKELKKSPEREQLRVFAAGPMANLVTALAVLAFSFVLFSFVLAPVFGSWAEQEYSKAVSGIVVARVDQNVGLCGRISPSPAFGKLEVGMLVKQVNGKDINAEKDFSREIQKAGKSTYELTVLSQDANSVPKKVSITPDKMGFHGYKVDEKLKPNTDFSQEYKLFSLIINSIGDFLYWLLILCFVIGLANYLPLEPFDGGKITKIVLLPCLGFLHKPKEEKEKIISKIFFYIVLALLILNAVPFFL